MKSMKESSEDSRKKPRQIFLIVKMLTFWLKKLSILARVNLNVNCEETPRAKVDLLYSLDQPKKCNKFIQTALFCMKRVRIFTQRCDARKISCARAYTRKRARKRAITPLFFYWFRNIIEDCKFKIAVDHFMILIFIDENNIFCTESHSEQF